MSEHQTIAQSLLGSIEWSTPTEGFCRCPGQAMHSQPNGERDCTIYLDRVPTVYCVHSSCSGEIERVNHQLRSAIAKGKCEGKSWAPTAEDIRHELERKAKERLKERASLSVEAILRSFAAEPADLFEESPVRLLDDPRDDWRLLLPLFDSAAVVWIGDTVDSGAPRHAANFRTAEEWLKERAAPGNFTCGATFKAGSCSRSNDNAWSRPFLVVESDILGTPQICAVFAWMRQFMRLRAVVDTGGKSLHGWFDFPSAEYLEELRLILPQLGCDPALFKASQPVRLPGARRGDKVQALLYLNTEAA